MDVIGIVVLVFGLLLAIVVGVWVYVNGWKNNGLWKAIVGGISFAFVSVGSLLCIKSCTKGVYDTRLKYAVKKDEVKKEKQKQKERDIKEKEESIKVDRKKADLKNKEIKNKKRKLDEESEITNEELRKTGQDVVDNNSPNDEIVNRLDNLRGGK